MEQTPQPEPRPLALTEIEQQSAEWHHPPPPGRARHDGWSPDRIRIFLTTLSECGVVADAARAAGMSVAGAYAYRNRAAGRAFNIAWNAAAILGRRRLADAVQSRAMHGWVETIRRDGEIVAQRNRFDNRLSMAVLTRLDVQARGGFAEDRPAAIAAGDFDRFLDLVCRGGDGADAFIAARRDDRSPARDLLKSLFGRTAETREDDHDDEDEPGIDQAGDAAGAAEPAAAAERADAVAADDISDLDPAFLSGWTGDQARRALRLGLVDRFDPQTLERFRFCFPDLES